VVMDGDRPELKSLFLDGMLADAYDQTAFRTVVETNRQLTSMHYQTQINPREINLFYLTDNMRERIVRTENGFHVLHSEIRWNDEELRTEMRSHPERFSPNVVLRPMYQEHILPNLAYIGGAGELAYWMQLKATFTQFGCSFPVLVLRNHLMLLDEQTSSRMKELNIVPRDLFHSVDELIRAHVLETVDADIDLSDEQQLLTEIYERLKATASDIDQTLIASLEAELVRQRQTIGQWGARFGRVLKKKNETSVERIRKLHTKLFPNNSLQERYDNLLQYQSLGGDELMDRLHDNILPFSTEMGVLHL
jgi:bacillithiol synthase